MRRSWPLVRNFAMASAVLALAGVPAGAGGCYTGGGGNEPPLDSLNFPVGLAVSEGGNVLYVLNSDFDLQWSGGSLQAYDLTMLRRHVLRVLANPSDPYFDDVRVTPLPKDTQGNPIRVDGVQCRKTIAPQAPDSQTPAFGQACAPPIQAQLYVRDAGIVGAFGTTLHRSPYARKASSQDVLCTRGDRDCISRLYGIVRGNASLTWAEVAVDDPNVAPQAPAQPDPNKLSIPTKEARAALTDPASPTFYAPFFLRCGRLGEDGAAKPGDPNFARCGDVSRDDAERNADAPPDPAAFARDHAAGNTREPGAGTQTPASGTAEPGNTRYLTMPGEPFGMTEAGGGKYVVVTHQTDTKTSLFTALTPQSVEKAPSLQFIAEGIALGGVGVAEVPHDPEAFGCTPGAACAALPRPAVLETSRATAQVSLLRIYSDQGSTLQRPYMILEGIFPLSAASSGADSRGIVIDPTPRLRCKSLVAPGDPARDAKIRECARLPARVFIASRSPASVVYGEIGGELADGSYDPDRLVLLGNVPLTAGPSNLYLAPIVDRDGRYALRLFVVAYDSNAVFIIDPDTRVVESAVRVGPGPFAMAFDPFDLEAVARGDTVPFDDVRFDPGTMRRYRFAYVSIFRESYVQVIDLDGSRAENGTFETIVFNLGAPRKPKGG
jgi:YVTN family beta-propeller protein